MKVAGLSINKGIALKTTPVPGRNIFKATLFFTHTFSLIYYKGHTGRNYSYSHADPVGFCHRLSKLSF